MKNTKLSFWLIVIIGVIGILSSIYLFLKGEDFSSYFWGGFFGITLVGVAIINSKKFKKK